MKTRFLCAFAIGLLCCARFLFASASDPISEKERRSYIRRAQIWHPTSVASMNLIEGPTEGGAFKLDETVHCRYVQKERHGTSRKFFCRLDSGEVVKVRYGLRNNEVFGQVVASRLLWALGFGANSNYLVRVICHHCSSDPWNDPEPNRDFNFFYPATIERKLKGKEVTEGGPTKTGWGWNEIEWVNENEGGATRAQIDALKLLAVFMAHVDSRSDNQRLICLDSSANDEERAFPCEHPYMYVSDVGTTFGGAHEFEGYTTLKLRYWENWPVWKHPSKCIADLEPAERSSGKLSKPKISEAGRKFLADLLVQLSDQQIRDLFHVAHANWVRQLPGYVTVDDWVEAFKRRRDQIVNLTCPE